MKISSIGRIETGKIFVNCGNAEYLLFMALTQGIVTIQLGASVVNCSTGNNKIIQSFQAEKLRLCSLC